MTGVIRAWQVPAEESGEYVEVRETETRDGVSIAILRGSEVARVWLSRESWDALMDLHFKGPQIHWPVEAKGKQETAS